MNLLKNITRVVFANIITLISNLILGLVLPIFLSVNEFGEYRLFLLYASYVGFLHFGFIDAIYLKYGGMEVENIDKKFLKKERNVFFIYQLTISLISLIIAFVVNDLIFIFASLMIITINNGTFHKLFYQATGQFKKYSKINIIFSILNLVLIMFLLLLEVEKAIFYILVTLLSHLVVLLIMERAYRKFTHSYEAKGEVEILSYNKIGIFILLGNIGVMLITNLGLWTVNFLFTIEYFAVYAFSIAMMNMILLLINAVGLTFYNYIAKRVNEKELGLIKELLVIIGAFGGSAYFLFDPLVNWILPQYIDSLNIIAISFMVFPYLIVINIIIINLYKAKKQQKRYLINVLSILSIGITLTLLSVAIFESMEAIALATYFTFVIWFFYATTLEFKFLKGTKLEISFLVIHGVTFYVTATYFNWLSGLTIYLITIFLSSILILYNKKLPKVIDNKFKRKG